ncbi:DWNN domain-containing protein [Apodospora peruviana]|uniref:DWNN domain-containing protein n=1 Tax=Apodospora peruviana TaxID=516989 RepID=A0AAE0IJH3_9PEZI|nr:DWNN domain-containing protein [Apodospora peruviana]
MASSVFFKFKSQKEPTRVEFDGTGISVFELKREIIVRTGLGDGTDFDLVIYADEGMKEVYDDDTTIIPRSTTVIARRMPPRIAGRGGAARYVSGKMPVHAKNSSRKEQIVKPLIKASSTPVVQLNSAMTEEEKMLAVFQAQTEHFTSREEEMATQQYVAKSGIGKKPANVPDHEPPQGYICYRCGEKGHWIQLCPTNDNPEYDNRPRVKRTTGIPKSFLRTVDKATALGQNADGEDVKTPSGIMVNADGEFVIAEPDKASWEQFQAKAKSNAAAQTAASDGDKEVQERGLECPIDKKMFIDPMKTPCCEKTYCNDCITNALIESDFVCPGCKAENVLIDDLKADEEAVRKMKTYLAEKDSKAGTGSKSPKSPTVAAPKSPDSTTNGAPTTDANGKAVKKEGSQSPSPATAQAAATSQTSQGANSTSTPKSATSTPVNGESKSQLSKKRPAEELAENPKVPKAPKAMQKSQQETQQQSMMEQMMSGMAEGMNPMNGMTGMNGMMGGMPGMPGMPMMFAGMPMMPGNFGGGPSGMPNMNAMNAMMNPMMGMNPMMATGMPGGGFPVPVGGPGGFNGLNGANGAWGGGPGDMGMGAMGGMGGMGGMGIGMVGGMNMGGPGGPSMNMNGMMNGGPGGGPHMNGQHNQQFIPNHQHKVFSNQAADEEDAYFRKPVNPHRHQNRQRRIRPSDYREL